MFDLQNLPKFQDLAGRKLEFQYQTSETVCLKHPDGGAIEVDRAIYPRLITNGLATKPARGPAGVQIPDEHARLHQAMILHAIRRNDELRTAGNSAKSAQIILHEELLDDDRYRRYVPARLSLRTIQHWRRKLSKGGKDALIPHVEKRGNRGHRFDKLFEEAAWNVLEEIFLKTDRVSIGKLTSLVEERYLAECRAANVEPGICGKRCLQAVLDTMDVDDIIKARHDKETSKKLRLQAQFYHRVQAPMDLVEIDCTPGDIFLVGATGDCIGRPVICVAIDVATGFPVGLRLTLEAEHEALTVATLKDVMTDRGNEFFEDCGIQNRFETTGTPKVIHSDQGSGNSGPQLQAIIRNVGCEWGKNIPGCPEKKPHVERFNREMNSFLHTLPGSSFSDELPNKERIEKGMLEATYTLDELRVLLARWVYDVYVKKVRRAIHSPMRQAKSPLQSWKQLECEMLLPAAPEDIREMFMVEKTVRKVQHYGIEVLGVHFHSNALRDLIQRIGRKTSVEVRYDPSDIREIAVLDPETGLHFPVAAKSEDVLAVSYADAKKLREPSKDAMCADASARATAAQIAINAQKLAESRGRGSIKSIRSARAQERVRQKEREILDSSKRVPGVVCSDIEKANQPTPKLTVRRPTQLPVLDQME